MEGLDASRLILPSYSAGPRAVILRHPSPHAYSLAVMDPEDAPGQGELSPSGPGGIVKQLARGSDAAERTQTMRYEDPAGTLKDLSTRVITIRDSL